MLRTLVAVALAAFLAVPAAAQERPGESFDAAEVQVAGPLDKVFGSADAPVTVIEYASLSCGHCRQFHIETWPTFKEQYVDTGKVRFVYRDFPLDAPASAASMLARCAGDERWYAMVDLFFRSQDRWHHADAPIEALTRTVGMAGMGPDDVEVCLKDEQIFQSINQVRERAATRFGVDGTPTFFINGRKEVGALTLDQLSSIIDPLIEASTR